MGIALLTCTIMLAAIALFSGIGKLRHDPKIVKSIHETCRVPMRHFPLLAACEMAGAVGAVAGIWWPAIGVAACAGLAIYFVGAVVAHLRVGDRAGVGPAAFMLALSVAAPGLRLMVHGAAL